MATVKNRSTISNTTSISRKQDDQKTYDYWTVLSAYQAGKKAGIELSNEVYKKAFKDNFNKSVEACRDIYSFLKEKDIKCHEILIRPEDVTEIDLLFAVSPKKFNSVEFAKIYPLTSNQIKGIKSKTLKISVSYMPYTEDMDGEKLEAEGFLTIYNDKKS